MAAENRVLIAGAGPAGLAAASFLVDAGIPVTVFEAAESLPTDPRASTFHPPTLDMLDDAGTSKRVQHAAKLRAPDAHALGKRFFAQELVFASQASSQHLALDGLC